MSNRTRFFHPFMVHIMPRIAHFDFLKQRSGESNIFLVIGCHTAFTNEELNSANLGWRQSSITRLMGDGTTFQVHVGQSSSLFFIVNLKPIDL